MSEKVNRKDLKGPDEFVSVTQRMGMWVAAHKGLVIGVIAIAVVGVLTATGLQWFLESRDMQASKDFVESFQILNARVVERADAAETTQADGTYASEADRAKAALGALESTGSAHAGSAVASLAAYFVAEEKRRLGDLDQAIQGFEAYLRDEGLGALMAPFAVEGIGSALEAQGKLEEARAHYRRLTEEAFVGHKDRGLYHLARLEQTAGRLEAAAQQFQAILDEFPQSVFAEDIHQRMSVLPEASPAKAPNATSEGQGALPKAEPAPGSSG